MITWLMAGIPHHTEQPSEDLFVSRGVQPRRQSACNCSSKYELFRYCDEKHCSCNLVLHFLETCEMRKALVRGCKDCHTWTLLIKHSLKEARNWDIC